MARYLTARSVSGAAVTRAAAELAAGQPTAAGGRQETAALVRLVDIGAAQWQAGGQVRWTGAMTVAEALTASDAQTAREKEIERTRLMMMRRYAEHPGCRRSFLLSYFGQDYPGPCGNCDNDIEHPEAERADVPFAVGSRVASELGRGHGAAIRRRPGHDLVRRTRIPRDVPARRTGTRPAALAPVTWLPLRSAPAAAPTRAQTARAARRR